MGLKLQESSNNLKEFEGLVKDFLAVFKTKDLYSEGFHTIDTILKSLDKLK